MKFWQSVLLLIAPTICSVACGCGGWESPDVMGAAEEFNAGAEPRRVAENAVREALKFPESASFSRHGIATESKPDEAHGGWNVYGIVNAKNVSITRAARPCERANESLGTGRFSEDYRGESR